MEPYIGEIRIFGGNFAPQGWAFCNGQIMAISEYDALFGLLGTTYGGNGQTTFALPDLRGRLPLHMGTSTTGSHYALGEQAGSEEVTLLSTQLPQHSHQAMAAASGDVESPSNTFWAGFGDALGYSKALPSTTMAPQALSLTGGNQPHENMMPSQALTFIIALFGIYPSPN